MIESTREPLGAGCADSRPGGVRSELRLAGMTLVWALSFVAVTWLLKSERVGEGIGAWLVALVPTVFAVVVVFDYGRFLRQADELQRLIQLRALAFCLGITWIGLAGYPLLERLGAPASTPSDFVVLMSLAYVAGTLVAWRHYR